MIPEAAGSSLILSRADIERLMDPDAWLEAVELGFRAFSQGKAASPPPMKIAGRGGAFHAKGASLILERVYAALKLNGNFPDNPSRGLPTIQGALLLCDGENGALLAIIDSIEVTLRRTAAATALAARHLARADSETILVCGCGDQALAQLEALRRVLPLERLLAWDRDPDRAAAFARTASTLLKAEPVNALAPAARGSDVIVTCTTAKRPFLDPDCVSPGTFIAAVGADSEEKSEIAPALMRRALVVADILDQCAAMGDLHHAMAAGAMTRDDVHAELVDLVTGARPGRTSADQVTLFDSTGTALQDVAAAAILYRRASAEPGLPSVRLGRAA